MKKNIFKKYMQLMKKSNIYYIENDLEWYYIFNSYMLLRVPSNVYRMYFNGYDPELFPVNDIYERTIEVRKRRNERVQAYIEKSHIASAIPARNTFYAVKTKYSIDTGEYNCSCFVTMPEPENMLKPFITMIKNEFVAAFENIFNSEECFIYGGTNENKPLLFVEHDYMGFVLPVIYNGNSAVQNAIIEEYTGIPAC